MRRAAFLVIPLVLAGCAGGTTPPPEPVAEARPPEPSPLPQPLLQSSIAALPVRGAGGEAPPEPPPKPKPGTMELPDDGGAWPWKLAPAPAVLPAQPVTYPVPKGAAPSGLAVARAARKAVVTVTDRTTTTVILCDLATGKVVTEWELNGEFGVIDLSPDATRMLVLRAGTNAPRDVLHVWTIADLDLTRKAWQPHDSAKAAVFGELTAGSADATGRQVQWAAFAGTDRIVTSAHNGQLRVWDAAKLERLGTIEAAHGAPAVSPDGTRVVFLTARGAALLDPATATVVGTREFAFPAETRTLAISPSGTMLACAGNERVSYLNLATGENWDAVGQKLGEHTPWPKSFGWVGESHVMAEHRLFDTESPLTLWRYGGWEQIVFRNHEAWVATSTHRTHGTVIGFTLPQPGLVEGLAKKMRQPDLFVLKAGDAVRVDVSGLPEDKQAWAQQALEKRLGQIGYRASPAAAAVLYASEDKTASPASAGYLGGGALNYTARNVRLKLVRGGETLWQTYAHVGAPYSWPYNKPAAQMISEHGIGRPNYAMFGYARIPPVFTGPNFPHYGFGHTILEPKGMTGDLVPR